MSTEIDNAIDFLRGSGVYPLPEAWKHLVTKHYDASKHNTSENSVWRTKVRVQRSLFQSDDKVPTIATMEGHLVLAGIENLGNGYWKFSESEVSHG